MKKIIVILWLGVLVLPGLLPAQSKSGQSIPEPKPIQSPPLTRFNLDFEGGSPGNLVSAIEALSHKPMKTIIPFEFADLQIPSFSMRGVTVPELFTALSQIPTGRYLNGNSTNIQDQMRRVGYGFKTEGVPREDSVWCFFHEGQEAPGEPKPKVICRFYQLAPYLETYKVEDITTAIETGWKMLGKAPMPKVSFHQDTKLLIAAGDSEQLQMIDSVIQQLIIGPHVNQFIQETNKAPASGKSREPAKP